MTSATTLELLQPVMLAVGPALVTGTVALIAPMLLERRKQEADRRKRRIEKLEDLVASVHEHDHWIDQAKSKYIFGRDVTLGRAPILHVEATVKLHFPALEAAARDLYMKAKALELWAIKAGRKRMNNEPNYTDGFDEVQEPFATSSGAFISAVVKLAHDEAAEANKSLYDRVTSWFSRR